MRTQLTFAAVAVAAAAAAFSAQASDQLALSVGVEPGVYSTSELIQLRDAAEKGDLQQFNFVANREARTGLPVSSQLANQLGVAPGTYSTAELVALKSAIEDDDYSEIAFIENGSQSVTRDAAVSSSDRNVQLAAALGVNAADYTTAELASAYLNATGSGDD